MRNIFHEPEGIGPLLRKPPGALNGDPNALVLVIGERYTAILCGGSGSHRSGLLLKSQAG